MESCDSDWRCQSRTSSFCCPFLSLLTMFVLFVQSQLTKIVHVHAGTTVVLPPSPNLINASPTAANPSIIGMDTVASPNSQTDPSEHGWGIKFRQTPTPVPTSPKSIPYVHAIPHGRWRRRHSSISSHAKPISNLHHQISQGIERRSGLLVLRPDIYSIIRQSTECVCHQERFGVDVVGGVVSWGRKLGSDSMKCQGRDSWFLRVTMSYSVGRRVEERSSEVTIK